MEDFATQISAADHEIVCLQVKINELSDAKRECEGVLQQSLSRLRVQGHLPPKEYKSLCGRQDGARRKIREIEPKIKALKMEVRQWSNIATEARHRALASHAATISSVTGVGNSALKIALTGLRDEYLRFSEDHTRVNSMRMMAAQFARELTDILAPDGEVSAGCR